MIGVIQNGKLAAFGPKNEILKGAAPPEAGNEFRTTGKNCSTYDREGPGMMIDVKGTDKAAKPAARFV